MRMQDDALKTEEYVDWQYFEPEQGKRCKASQYGRQSDKSMSLEHDFVLRAGRADQALSIMQQLVQSTARLGHVAGGGGNIEDP